MNCQKLFQDFNSSKFVVYTSLLIFSILFALRLDQTIQISWWLVFTPLWIWKSLVIAGAMVGVLVWICNPDYRLSESSYTHFKSMLISLSLQLLLLMFELLVCDKLESDRHFWTLAFIPLIFISLLSVAVSVWAMKNERDYELELFCSVNVLQFIFIALRLDRFITWSWVVVFVPLWILLCLAIIGVLYALIFAVILFRTPEVSLEQRKASFYTAIAYVLVVLPMLIFFVLLSSKLDAKEFRQTTGSTIIGSIGGEPIGATYGTVSGSSGFNTIHIYSHISLPPVGASGSSSSSSLSSTSSSNNPSSSTLPPPAIVAVEPALPSQHHHQIISTPMSHHHHHHHQSSTSPFFSAFGNTSIYSFDMDYFSVCVPLYFTLSILICMSFSSKGGNLWWFGMRKDFCSFLLILCPCLREYANISYNFNNILLQQQQNQQNDNNRDQDHHQQNERTNLTAVHVVQNLMDYDTTDGSTSSSKQKKNRWIKQKKTSAITQQPAIVIPNLMRLDMPD